MTILRVYENPMGYDFTLPVSLQDPGSDLTRKGDGLQSQTKMETSTVVDFKAVGMEKEAVARAPSRKPCKYVRCSQDVCVVCTASDFNIQYCTLCTLYKRDPVWHTVQGTRSDFVAHNDRYSLVGKTLLFSGVVGSVRPRRMTRENCEQS